MRTLAGTFADYRARSFWLEQATAGYLESPTLEGVVRADILVIGGGLTGISAAYHLKLAEPSLRVVLLESEVTGYGASGRNAGLIAPLVSPSLNLAAARFGAQRAREARRYAERACACLVETIERRRLDCEYEARNYLRVPCTPAQLKRAQQEIALARRLGIEDIEWLEAGAVREQIDSPTYLGALRESRAGLVNPARLVRELRRIAIANGVEIYEHSPAINLEFSPADSVRVVRAQTPRGAVEADRCVLATNAYSAQFPALRARQFPLHTYAVLTEPLTPAQLSSLGWRERQALSDLRMLPHYYRLTADNRLLAAGGSARYFAGNQTAVNHDTQAFEDLAIFIDQTFPSLRGIAITQRWSWVVSATADLAPALGVLGNDQRIVYSLGNLEDNVALSYLNGRVLSDLLLERKTDLTDVFFVKRATIPLPPEPARSLLINSALGLLHIRNVLRERQR
ncbi:MAG: NAD(P)/FAD-dependent oxidoreductase [Anaerolineae bacterium]